MSFINSGHTYLIVSNNYPPALFISMKNANGRVESGLYPDAEKSSKFYWKMDLTNQGWTIRNDADKGYLAPGDPLIAVEHPLVCSEKPFFWDIWPTEGNSVNKFGIFVRDMPTHVRVDLKNDHMIGGTIQLNYENNPTQIWSFIEP